MRKKLTLLAFSLLLAVGWTNDASAQRKRSVSQQSVNAPSWEMTPVAEQEQVLIMPENGESPLFRRNAPRRGHSDVVANEVKYTKAQYAAIPYYWYDDTVASGTRHTGHLTDTVTNAYQMYWMLRSAYMDTSVPGILYNDVFSEATQYYGVGHGWNIGTATSPEIRISLDDSYGYVMSITITDMRGNTVDSWTCTSSNYSSGSTNFPSTWRFSSSGWSVGRFTYNGYYRYGIYPTSSSGAFIRIPAATYGINNYPDGLRVTVQAMGRSGGTTNQTAITLNNGLGWYLNYSEPRSYISIAEGTRTSVDAPDYNAYTVFLIKLKDFEPTISTSDAFTHYTSELIDVFTNYFESVELLTDGLRVGEDTETSGTVFAYRGVLNRFYFIGKGKTATRRSDYQTTQGFAILGPFYEMYEEFSPTTTDSGAQTQDFYTDMHGGAYYPVKHDCATVLGYQHYFSMYGKDTTVYKSVSPMVLYIPDVRSKESSRNYEEGHQPQVGLYTIKLTAETEPVADYSDPDNRNYIVYLDWTSSLNQMVNNTVDQTYIIYTVTYDANNKPIYTPLDTVYNVTTYDYIVPQQQTSQQIEYVIMGYPTNATNNPEVQEGGIFFTYSDPDDVQIPGWFDFMILYRERYESDFVIQEEKNYYRNYLYPTNLAPGTGMTMEQLKKEWPNQTASYTLWRDNLGIAKLEVRAIGDKVYYRIRYYEDTQVTTGPNAIGVDDDKKSGNAKMPYNYVEIPNE